MKKEFGEVMVLAFLTKLINELGRCVQNDWSADDKPFFAESLMNEFWYIRMDDFVMAFKKGISGSYGKVYGKLDYSTICEWINKWWEERQNYLSTKTVKEQYDTNRSSEMSIKGMIENIKNKR